MGRAGARAQGQGYRVRRRLRRAHRRERDLGRGHLSRLPREDARPADGAVVVTARGRSSGRCLYLQHIKVWLHDTWRARRSTRTPEGKALRSRDAKLVEPAVLRVRLRIGESHQPLPTRARCRRAVERRASPYNSCSWKSALVQRVRGAAPWSPAARSARAARHIAFREVQGLAPERRGFAPWRPSRKRWTASSPREQLFAAARRVRWVLSDPRHPHRRCRLWLTLKGHSARA